MIVRVITSSAEQKKTRKLRMASSCSRKASPARPHWDTPRASRRARGDFSNHVILLYVASLALYFITINRFRVLLSAGSTAVAAGWTMPWSSVCGGVLLRIYRSVFSFLRNKPQAIIDWQLLALVLVQNSSFEALYKNNTHVGTSLASTSSCSCERVDPGQVARFFPPRNIGHIYIFNPPAATGSRPKSCVALHVLPGTWTLAIWYMIQQAASSATTACCTRI